MNQHLGVPFNPLVELIVRHLRIVNANLMAHHETRLRFAGNDQVSQVAIV